MSKPHPLDNPDYVLKIKVLFEETHCAKGLGQALGVSKTTAHRYLKALGLHFPVGHPKGDIVPPTYDGGLSVWIQEHPGETLPTKVRDIKSKTNLTTDQVKSFLYRLRKKHQNSIDNIGDLRTYRGALKGSRGTIIAFVDIKEYSLKHSSYSDEIHVKATLHKGEQIEFKTTLSRLARYRSIEALPSQESMEPQLK